MRHTSKYHHRIYCGIAVAAGLVLFPALQLRAGQKHKPHPAEKHTVHRNVKSNDKPVKRHYTHHSTRHTTKRHRHHYRYRYSRHHRHWPLVRLQPERVKEIQQALVRTGYLQEAPSGRWDTATRGAMQRYQQANGFKPTGLPEAKPLMKLGLGPHPLPPSLEPLPAANGDTTGTTEANALPNTPAPAKASASAQAQ